MPQWPRPTYALKHGQRHGLLPCSGVLYPDGRKPASVDNRDHETSVDDEDEDVKNDDKDDVTDDDEDDNDVEVAEDEGRLTRQA